MAQLMPHTQLIHLGAGRPDFVEEQKNAHFNSMDWLSDLLQSNFSSRIWKMLEWIKTRGYSHIPIVLEIPSSGIYLSKPRTSRFLSESEYCTDMKQIVDNIRLFMASP
jgi:hypothetical protein